MRPRSLGDHTESENEGSVGSERGSGDGPESQWCRWCQWCHWCHWCRLVDEDKKNPQYILERGTFYEHDDRTIDEDPNSNTADQEKDKELKKKVWQDKMERWSHDRFNESEQAPKSSAELVAIYGYDIRNEDGPPMAKRRKEYGCGPKKYTRNWRDVDAYSYKARRTRMKKPQKKATQGEDFPPPHYSRLVLNLKRKF